MIPLWVFVANQVVWAVGMIVTLAYWRGRD
jgi:hypothetical protein